jgi:hypothetical protein
MNPVTVNNEPIRRLGKIRKEKGKEEDDSGLKMEEKRRGI